MQVQYVVAVRVVPPHDAQAVADPFQVHVILVELDDIELYGERVDHERAA